jgi:hypothetical protein
MTKLLSDPGNPKQGFTSPHGRGDSEKRRKVLHPFR